MCAGVYRPFRRYRSCRLRHLFLSNRPWVFLFMLTAFITINWLLYRGIDRPDDRSIGLRSLTVKTVISIDSWQADVGGPPRELYIDSPRSFKGLARNQREKGDLEARANQTSAPAVRYIRRGGGGHYSIHTQKATDDIQPDTTQSKAATVAKRVNARFNYEPKNDKRPGVQIQTGKYPDGSRRNDDEISRWHVVPRKLVHVQSESIQSKVVHVPPKSLERVPTVPMSNRQSGTRTRKTRTSLKNAEADSEIFYHHPTWLDQRDIDILRRLSDDPISGFSNFPAQHSCKLGLGFLIYESESTLQNHGQTTDGVGAIERCSVQGVTCAVVFSPAEIHRVLAFHLDRVLGFHRTLPTVSRRLPRNLRRQVGLPVDVSFPLMLYEPSLYNDEEFSKIGKTQLTACVSGDDDTLGLEWCNNVLTDDWSAVALFDFLLQIYQRLDLGCCGVDRWERLRRCGNSGASRGRGCTNSTTGSSRQKIGFSYRLRSQSDQLVLVENLVDLRAPVDKLDVWILQGLHSFPARAVAMLREGRLRRKLLHSLSVDKTYWEDQGGLLAIEEILDIMDSRGRLFLHYIDS